MVWAATFKTQSWLLAIFISGSIVPPVLLVRYSVYMTLKLVTTSAVFGNVAQFMTFITFLEPNMTYLHGFLFLNCRTSSGMQIKPPTQGLFIHCCGNSSLKGI